VHKKYQEAVDVEVIATEKLGATMATTWQLEAAAGTLTWHMVLSDIFQVVFNLAAVQAHMALTVDSTVFDIRARVNDKPFEYIAVWEGQTFRFKTKRYWKWENFTNCSLIFNDTRLVSLDNLQILEQEHIPYQRDLIMFARSAHPILQSLRKQIKGEDTKGDAILQTLTDWMTCESSNTDITPIRLMELEEKVCMNSNLKDCKRAYFDALSKAGTCNNSIPHLQKQHFVLLSSSKAAAPTEMAFRLDLPAAQASGSPSRASTPIAMNGAAA
jgi:hypothetical protein